jgi:hypothetical protein
MISVDKFPELVLYRVLSCTVALPGAGQCNAWAVVQVMGLRESPAVAILLNRTHADQYADFLMRGKIEIFGTQR